MTNLIVKQKTTLIFHEVCIVRIKKQVEEKGSTVNTHRDADCLLKNTPTKHNKYVVYQKLKHFNHITFWGKSEWFLIGRHTEENVQK
jgi:hypothetical protein